MFFFEFLFFSNRFFPEMGKINIAYALLFAPVYLRRDSGMAEELIAASSDQVCSDA